MGNMVVMEFIGNNSWPYPQLREATFRSFKRITSAYVQTILNIRIMYQFARLVHADLSEYNIIYHTKLHRVFFIDVGQAVEKQHPQAEEFLRRDIETITNFFSSKIRSRPLLPAEEVYQFVVGDEDYNFKRRERDGFPIDSELTGGEFELTEALSNLLVTFVQYNRRDKYAINFLLKDVGFAQKLFNIM